MEAENRKRRSENFSEEELSKLLELIAKHEEILHGKGHNINIFKEQAWREIACELNSEGGVQRTWKQLRAKYDKWKSEQRKKGSGEPIIRICEGKELDDVELKPHISKVGSEITHVLDQGKKMDTIQSKPQISKVDSEIKESVSLSCDSFDHNYGGENFEEVRLLEDPFSGINKWEKQFQILPKGNLDHDNDCLETENEVVQLRLELLKKEFEFRQRREEQLHREKIKILQQEQVINTNRILLQQMEIKRIKLSTKQ